MTELMQFLVGGLSSGAMYALIALGWVLIFNVSNVLNLAQGEFLMLGALAFTWFHLDAGLPIGVAVILAIAVPVVAAIVMDVVALRRLKHDQIVPMILVTLGASFVLREVAKIWFGKDPLRHAPFITGSAIEVFGAFVLPQTLLVWAGTAVLLLALWLFFSRSLYGKGMRACAENPLGATAVGISPSRMRTLSFAISAAIGAIGGILLIPLTAMSWDGGTLIGLKGFVAAVLGGMGSYPGAALGGIVLGVLESLGAGYISSTYKDAFAVGILLVLLLLRPQGLLGKRDDPERKTRFVRVLDKLRASDLTGRTRVAPGVSGGPEA